MYIYIYMWQDLYVVDYLSFLSLFFPPLALCLFRSLSLTHALILSVSLSLFLSLSHTHTHRRQDYSSEATHTHIHAGTSFI